MTSAWFVAGLGSTLFSTAASLFAAGTICMTETSMLVFDYPGTNPWSLLPFYPFFFNPRSGPIFLRKLQVIQAFYLSSTHAARQNIPINTLRQQRNSPQCLPAASQCQHFTRSNRLQFSYPPHSFRQLFSLPWTDLFPTPLRQWFVEFFSKKKVKVIVQQSLNKKQDFYL